MTNIRNGFSDEAVLGEDLPLPPARLFERLAQVPGYTWDQSVRFTSFSSGVGQALTSGTVHTISYKLRPLVSTFLACAA